MQHWGHPRQRLPRRYVWQLATHRLFGLVGLDPAGNVIVRFRENCAGFGGWTRTQHFEGGRTFPLHSSVGARLVELARVKTSRVPAVNAAVAGETVTSTTGEAVVASGAEAADVAVATGAKPTSATAAAAAAANAARWDDPASHLAPAYDLPPGCFIDPTTNVLRIDPVVSMWPKQLRKLRLRPGLTATYKLLYYSSWFFLAYGAVCLYLRVKCQWCGLPARTRLNAAEDSLADVFKHLLPADGDWQREARSLGVPKDIAERVAAIASGAFGLLRDGAVAAGYRPNLYREDTQVLSAMLADALRRKRRERMRIRAWWSLAGFLVLFVAYIVMML